MRKIDYTKTAAYYRHHIAYYESMRNNAITEDRKQYADGALMASAAAAKYFADNLAVDKPEFLKACGLKP
jgi:hypothetical protein